MSGPVLTLIGLLQLCASRLKVLEKNADLRGMSPGQTHFTFSLTQISIYGKHKHWRGYHASERELEKALTDCSHAV